MSADAARQRYLADAVATATPAKLVVMLYDRLALDLRRAADLQERGDPAAASEHVRHAQSIVAELRATLDLTAWDGAAGLAALYGYLLTELIAVHAVADPERVRRAGTIVAELRSAWSAAAGQLADAAETSRATREPATAGAWVG